MAANCQIIHYEDTSIENIVEQLIENSELEDFDITDLIEIVRDLQENPLNLNTASENELSKIIFLTPLEVNAIISHRERFGNFIAPEELQTINEFDNAKLALIRNFFTVSERDRKPYNLREIIASGNSTLFLKYKRVLENKKGYIEDEFGNSPYLGTPDHYFARYRFDSGRSFKAGTTMEKDPGEDFFKGNNKYGFDFYSAYVYAEDISPHIRAVNLGDYTISLGQGLILHNGFGGGKSVYTIDIKRDGSAIRPYSSVNETNFFRGGAITASPIQNLNITGFYSHKKIDGTLLSDTLLSDGFSSFRSIVRDGLHRTINEIEKEGSISQTNFGGRVEYNWNRFKLALNHLDYHFSIPLQQNDDLYRRFNFSGKRLSLSSGDYSFRFKNINAFGEIATSHNGGFAQLHSILFGLDKHLDLAISYRKYDRNYQGIEGNAFSEGTLPVNEEGFYFGIESRINNNWKISSYMDFWKNPWLRFRVDAPSNGREFLFRMDYVKKRKYNFYIQYRYETKGINSTLETQKTDRVVYKHSHRSRVHLSYQVNKEIELRSRAEFTRFDLDGKISFGHLLYQDIFYRPGQKPYSFNARLALFDTDNFDTRIYTYENDLLYEFYIPFYQGQGVRTYINLKYRITKDLRWEFRYARTLLSDMSSFSSGNEFIDSNRRSEIKTQIKYSF
jgi:hypothetical protein